MTTEKAPKQMTWDTLNLCIGSIFEIMQSRREFSTADIAQKLATHGVEVTNWPEEVLERLRGVNGRNGN